MIKIECITVGAFHVNTYLITDISTSQSAIIDTGETTELLEYLQSITPPVDIRKIFLTHGHLDHAGSLVDLQNAYPTAQTYLPILEKPLFETLPQQGDWFGAPEMNRPCGRIDHWINDGEKILLGDTTWCFISTPGHTPGQGCYYNETDIFVGDTLFAGSIGRTDLPMGNASIMQQSLKKLMRLPSHLCVHSGHGPTTTLAKEIEFNPFLI